MKLDVGSLQGEAYRFVIPLAILLIVPLGVCILLRVLFNLAGVNGTVSKRLCYSAGIFTLVGILYAYFMLGYAEMFFE
ncbi:hypothetical protein ABES80_00970 [Bacillus gobiensis]|uniref:hypothetical protein n=1 Tax=Bacillus gobiensis TaxID=1441095 RepID=UPI003D22E838